MKQMRARIEALEGPRTERRQQFPPGSLEAMTDAELEEVERLFTENEYGELDELPPPAQRRVEGIVNDALARMAERCSVKKPSNGAAWRIVGLNKR